MTPYLITAGTAVVIFLFGILIGAFIGIQTTCRRHCEHLDNIKTAMKHPGGFNGR